MLLGSLDLQWVKLQKVVARHDHYNFSSSNVYLCSVLTSTLIPTFFLHIKKFCCPPFLGPVSLGGLPAERWSGRECGRLDLTPSFTSGFLEISYNPWSQFPTLQLRIPHFPQGRWCRWAPHAEWGDARFCLLVQQRGLCCVRQELQAQAWVSPASGWHVVKPLPCLSHRNSAGGHGLIQTDEWGCLIRGDPRWR